MNRINAFINETPGEFPSPPLHIKKALAMNQEEGRHQNVTTLVPLSWTFQPLEVRNKFLSFISCPVCGILL